MLMYAKRPLIFKLKHWNYQYCEFGVSFALARLKMNRLSTWQFNLCEQCKRHCDCNFQTNDASVSTDRRRESKCAHYGLQIQLMTIVLCVCVFTAQATVSGCLTIGSRLELQVDDWWNEHCSSLPRNRWKARGKTIHLCLVNSSINYQPGKWQRVSATKLNMVQDNCSLCECKLPLY